MNCLITGCGLHDLGSGRFAHGDLFEVGDTYVFNAVVHDSRINPNTVWMSAPQTDLIVLVNCNYFERRGVIVMHKRFSALSDAAKKHIYGENGTIGVTDANLQLGRERGLL